MNNEKKYWFKAKLYGWGWQPQTWQGWILTLLYVLCLISVFLNADANSHSGSDTLISFAPQFILSTVLFLIICYLKGEKQRWRWGK